MNRFPRLRIALAVLAAVGDAAAAAPSLTVDATAGVHAINPDIYGMNFADEPLARELGLPVRRWGGNSTTRYNWQIDTDNKGSNYYFENVPNPLPVGQTLPDGSAADQFVEQDRRTGTSTLMTIPMSGWVAKRRPPGDNHPYDCGFKVSAYGAQSDADPYDGDCGDGIAPDRTTELAGNDPADTSIASDPAFVQGWINHLVGKYGKASAGGVAFYELDNEPESWSSTHRDVRPQHLGYDELASRGQSYAAAIKASDASAKVIGPSGWGWTAYFYSDLDTAPGGAWWNDPKDREAHGDVPLIDWYLQQMKAWEAAHGQRILDYVDEHFYPQAETAQHQAVYSDAVDPATDALRLRSTRALWDPAYVDESWIGDTVQLIPRMRGWVSADYPGTKTSISEYNWGALGDINGALAEADVLGIFGREQLDMATLWAPPHSTDPGAYAFRMYLNYDGAGSKFGNNSVHAASSDQDTVSIYGARRGANGALTLMVVNKTGSTQSSPITLQHFTPGKTAAVYQYGAAALGAIKHLANATITNGVIQAKLPANSITLYVVPVGK